MSSASRLLIAIPSLEIEIRQCGRIPNRTFESSSRVSSAAHRAFCRAPGRPQTAAFAPLSSSEPQKRSSSADRSRLKDCIKTHRASLEPRSENSSVTDEDRPSTAISRKFTGKNRTMISATDVGNLVNPLPSRQHTRANKSSLSATRVSTTGTSIRQKTPATAIVRDSKLRKNVVENSETSVKNNNHCYVTPPPDILMLSATPEAAPATDCEQQLAEAKPAEEIFRENECETSSGVSTESSRPDMVVYYYSGERDRRHFDELGGDVKKYSVEIQCNDSQRSAAGLGRRGSPQNIALHNLLQRQLALNGRNQSDSDDVTKDVESLNALVSQFINARPPAGQLYYFAYGPDASSERFSTFIKRKPQDSSWALMYGFQLLSRSYEDQGEITWPFVQFCTQSAVQGRVYVISRDEAALIDSYVSSTQGFQTVLLPVWLVDSNESDSSTAEYCLPALVCVHPSTCI